MDRATRERAADPLSHERRHTATEQEKRAYEYTAAYVSKYGITEKDLLAAIYRGHLNYLINAEMQEQRENGVKLSDPKAAYRAYSSHCRASNRVGGPDPSSKKLAEVHDTFHEAGHPLDAWHDFWLSQIECVTEHGLPAVYGENAFSFLCDVFGGDLPWEPTKHEAVTKAIGESPRLESLRAAFEKRFGVDFWKNPDE